MVSLVRDHLKVVHVRCFAHTLNLIVKEAIKATEPFHEKVNAVKAVVTYFHRSAKATAKLKSTLSDMGMKQLKLCQDVETRWNSTLKMLRRYSELHRAVSGALITLGKADLIISDQTVEDIKTCCESLEPFDEATVLMSTEKRTSMSSMLVTIRQLQQYLKNEVTTSPLSNNLLKELTSPFRNPEDNFTGAAATLLDPRFKRLPFADDSLRIKHEERILNMLRPLFTESQTEQGEEADAATPLYVKKRSFMQSFVERVKTAEKASPKTITGPRAELQIYMGMKFLDMREDSVLWWQEHSALFQHLSNIARKFIFIPATSVPSERLFSKAGELISKRRNCLAPSTVDMILFLNRQ